MIEVPMFHRRHLIFGAAAAGVLAPLPVHAQRSSAGLVTPPASALKGGDFLWPKPPRSIVPYGPVGLDYAETRAGEIRVRDQMLWEAQTETYLARNAGGDAPASTAETLRTMNYSEFADSYYLGGAGPRSFYVGHVAIVEIDPLEGPMILEATPPDVRRLPYADWLVEHERDLVFHGRLRDAGPDAGARIAAAARRQVGKKYDFVNFDLLDERGFYCSKLAWMAVWKTLGLALDGNPDPSRLLWFSPKQMFYCDSIEHLNSQGARGEYAR